jgi:antitoxin component YwqK of YwqJK toxin-antitoxin module
MSNSLLLEKNLDRYALYDPLIAQRIKDVSLKGYHFCHTHRGELNLSLQEASGNLLYYHSLNGAAEEASQVFNKMEIKENKVLFIYGVGLGYYYDAIKKWLHQDNSRFLIFIEDDLAVLHRLFETENGARLLNDPQVIIQYFSRTQEKFSDSFQNALYRVIRGFARSFCFLSSLTLYAATREKICQEIRNQLFFGITLQSMQYGELTTYMHLLFYNFYANITQLYRSALTPLTIGKFSQLPILVVGAGPSLSEDIERIRLLQDKVIILASGSAMNVLNRNGIFPHLGAAIDPTTSQFSRLRTNFAFEIPYFYRPRVNHDALMALHGPLLYTNGFGNFKLSKWMEEKLGIATESTFDTGISTTNFSLGLAANLGCNPIFFVGVDLSYTNNDRYPNGVNAHPSEHPAEHEALNARERQILVGKGIDGQPVNTKMDWMLESQLISDLVPLYPQTTFINCTDRGLTIKGIKKISLKEAEESYFNEIIEAEDFVHATIQNACTPWVTTEKIMVVFQEWMATLTRCVDILKKLKEENYRLLQHCQSGHTLPEQRPYSGMQALLETELAEEEGYQYLLQDFNYVIDTIAISKQHQLKCHPELFNTSSLPIQKLEIDYNYYSYFEAIANDQLIILKHVLMNFENEQAVMQSSSISPPFSSKDSFYYTQDGVLKIIDEEMKINIEDTFVDKKIPPSKYLNNASTSAPYTEIFLTTNEQKEGQCLWLYPNGSIFSERYFRKNTLHGPLRFFTQEGTLLSESFFVNGKKEGKSRWNDNKGNRVALHRYRHGQRDGIQEYFYENGNHKSLLPFQDGKLHGKVLLFHYNGQKKRELNFIEGVLNGTECGWNLSGQKIFEAHYKDGQPFGESKSWDANGKVVISNQYP